MGRALARLLAGSDDMRIVGGIARGHPGASPGAVGYPELVDPARAGALIRRSAVVIDFSAPAQLGVLLERHGDALSGRALVVGTTGLDASEESALDRVAATAAVLSSPNFSVGVNVLLGLVERAARVLPPDRYDVEIVEAHHAGKEDAPSGTALALGRAVAEGRGATLEDVRRDGRTGRTGARPRGEIGFHAVRGGGVVGEHAVRFLGALEELVVEHRARSRDLFAEGAVMAARWLAGREPGRYTMARVLGLDVDTTLAIGCEHGLREDPGHHRHGEEEDAGDGLRAP
jgi:4-hydroxy-tetrahydrodipicolinate reductase